MLSRTNHVERIAIVDCVKGAALLFVHYAFEKPLGLRVSNRINVTLQAKGL